MFRDKKAPVPQKEAIVPQKEAIVPQKEALVPQKEALVSQKESLVPQKVFRFHFTKFVPRSMFLCLGTRFPGSNTFRHPGNNQYFPGTAKKENMRAGACVYSNLYM